MKINRRSAIWLYLLIPSLFLVVGSFLHYQRGDYYSGLETIRSEGADDAYISYRYGWNLAHFGVLSWNESGYRRTEGFTNPLWLFISSVWALLGHKDWVYPLMVLTSVSISAILLFFLVRLVYRLNGQSLSTIIGIFLFAMTPIVWLHTTSGLEGTVFGLGLALLAYLAIFYKIDEGSKVLIFLLALTLGWLRSDAFIYLAMIVLAGIISGTSSWKTIAFGLLVSLVTLLLWRQLAFGEWLPNTASAKVNFGLADRFSIGARYLFFSLLFSGLLVVFLTGVVGVLSEPKRRRLAGLFLIISWIAYYLYIGGDVYFERHLIGLFALAAALSAPLWVRSKPPARLLLIFTAIASISLSFTNTLGRFNYFSPKGGDPLVMLGKAVAENREYYGVLVVDAAGKVPFYAGGDCIDTVGLNDPELSKITRAQFVPGHSSGSEVVAIQIAQLHPSGVYSTLSFFNPQLLAGPEAVSLWVDNRHPQETVQGQPSQEQWNEALSSGDPFIWTIISMPVPVTR